MAGECIFLGALIMKRKSIVISVIFIFSTGIQLLSQILITRIFGASLELDQFLAAVTIPTIAVTVVYGTLNDAFLPYWGKIRKDHPEDVEGLFWGYVTTLTLIGTLVSGLFLLFSYPLMNFLFGGASLDINEIAKQFSFMVLALPLGIIATLFGSYYYSKEHYFRFPIAQLLGSIINVLLFLILYPLFGVWGLVIAFVVNIAFQILFVIPIIKLSFKIPNISFILIAWIPLIIGSFAIRSDAILIRSFGAGLGEGSLVYLNLLSKIFSLSTGLLTIGLQVVLLPSLVNHFTEKNFKQANKVIVKAKIVSVVVSLIATLILVLVMPLALHLLFVGGKFTVDDVNLALQYMPLFVLPAIGWGCLNVFFQPLIALKKQWQIGTVQVGSLVAGYLVAYSLTQAGYHTTAISAGLCVLLFGGIISAEILWQYYLRKIEHQ